MLDALDSHVDSTEHRLAKATKRMTAFIAQAEGPSSLSLLPCRRCPSSCAHSRLTPPPLPAPRAHPQRKARAGASSSSRSSSASCSSPSSSSEGHPLHSPARWPTRAHPGRRRAWRARYLVLSARSRCSLRPPRMRVLEHAEGPGPLVRAGTRRAPARPGPTSADARRPLRPRTANALARPDRLPPAAPARL